MAKKFSLSISIPCPYKKSNGTEKQEPSIVVDNGSGGNQNNNSEVSQELEQHIDMSNLTHETLAAGIQTNSQNITIVNNNLAGLTVRVDTLETAVGNKADANHVHSYSELENKPELNFAPADHDHNGVYALVEHSHASYVTADDVNAAITAAVTAAFKFIGSVSELPQEANPGDVYQVGETEYVRCADGSWIELGSPIDLSGYATTIRVEEIASIVDGKANASDVTSLTERVATIEGALPNKADASDITEFGSRVSAVENAVAGKAESADLQTLSATVVTIGEALSTKAGSADVTALETRVGGVESAVEGKASTADVEAIGSRVSTVETAIEGKASAESVSGLATRVQTLEGYHQEQEEPAVDNELVGRVEAVETALAGKIGNDELTAAIQDKVDNSTLENYVQKDGDKVLSDVNFTQQDKNKLDGLNNYDDSGLSQSVTDVQTETTNIRTDLNTEHDLLLVKVSKLQREIDTLKRAANVSVAATYNPTIVLAEEGSIASTDNTADVIISGQEVTNKTNMSVKSADVDNTEFAITYNSANAIAINATEDVAITNSTIDSDNPEQKSSNMIKVTSAEVLKLDGVEFTGETYNTVMTGQNTFAFLKYIDIINCDFNENAKHVNIWIGAWQDNAVCNIKNCHFNTMEQILLLGDGHLVDGNSNKLVINIEDCVIDNYDRTGKTGISATNLKYQGIIGCEAFNNGANSIKTAEQAAQLNPFGNVTINIKNVTAAGVRLTAADFKMGTQGEGQQIWLCFDKYSAYSNVVYGEDTKNLFPTVYVDGVLVEQAIPEGD